VRERININNPFQFNIPRTLHLRSGEVGMMWDKPGGSEVSVCYRAAEARELPYVVANSHVCTNTGVIDSENQMGRN
jgi:hypothetical protein